MAIDEVDQSDPGHLDGEDGGGSGSDQARVGEYTWREFMHEHGYSDEVSTLYEDVDGAGGLLGGGGDATPGGAAWDRVDFRPERYLGVHPDDLADWITEGPAARAETLYDTFEHLLDPDRTPVYKGTYTWEHFKREYFYDADGNPPRGYEEGDFDGEEYLGFPPENAADAVAAVAGVGEHLADLVDERTVDVAEDLDEDAFFSTDEGHTTVVNRYDMEKAVPLGKKTHFSEEERYWVNKPYSFVVVFHSNKENEKKYYAVEPHLNEIEGDLKEFLTGKLRTAIKYSDENVAVEDAVDREQVIEEETDRLLKRYDLLADAEGPSFLQQLLGMFGGGEAEAVDGELDGIETRPEPAVLEDDPDDLTEYQVEKLLYYLKRDFIGFERIDPIKHDINVEDISCDGYDSPVFVYHSSYENIISNIYHGRDELDDFVVKLAQRSGKGISKRQPQVDATLPDGSRAQLTLGNEVSDHGTNYTIRQFQDVPHTPIDLVNWKTFSLDEMAFLWLCIENDKSLIFAGGTASGKTTSLNAVSLFIPSNAKIVSIEDTREVELPQRNWIASVTRPSFTEDDKGDVDEFDLLEAALRQRPEYIVMGEVRGPEGSDLFQVMSTGHTSYSTFHADTVGEVLKRFTTDPINVSKTMFTALDLVSIQTQTRVQGHKVRRNKNITEINHYDAENDEINVQDVYQWQAETDEFLRMGDSNTLEEIKFDRGWGEQRLQEEMFKRRVILAYLIRNGLNTYTEVAATIQAFINDPDTILTLIAQGKLQHSLEDLREMESVLIDIDPDKEEQVPRPEPDDAGLREANDILEEAEQRLFEEYRGRSVEGLASALEVDDTRESPPLDELVDEVPVEFSGELDEEVFGGAAVPETDAGAGSAVAAAGDDAGSDGDGGVPDLFAGDGDDGGFAIEDDAPDWLHDDEDSHADWAEDAVSLGSDGDGDAGGGFGGFEEASVDDGEEETS